MANEYYLNSAHLIACSGCKSKIWPSEKRTYFYENRKGEILTEEGCTGCMESIGPIAGLPKLKEETSQ